jgi:hypothetical protein
MKNTKHLVIGLGQIGTAIRDILDADCVDLSKDKSNFEERNYEVLHICFSYGNEFVSTVQEYQLRFSPKITIIHSTVPVGTSEKLFAVHSPCRGIHPNLKEGILTFVKYFGGEKAEEAACYFNDCGIRTHTHPASRNTEAMKLWDTTIYGWNIILEKMIFAYCKENNLDFDLVYTKANESYNEGYEKLGHAEYKKYILKHIDGKIGGHCVMNNLDLLESEISTIVKSYNSKLS